MKRFLVFAMVFVFMAVMANAGEKGKTCAETCKVKCADKATAEVKTTGAEAKDAHEGCAAKAATSETAPAATTEATAITTGAAPKVAETCPDVKGQASFEAFHEAMHPMHMALEDGKYADLRKGYPELLKASEGIKAYSCPMGDKCPPECKKAFEDKKAGLLKDVEALGVACSGTDDKNLETSFMAMHEAYIGFTSMCQHEKPAAEEKK